MRYLVQYSAQVVFSQGPVRDHHCQLRLAPRADDRQNVHGLRIEMQPEAELQEWQDFFGNRVHDFSLLPYHEKVRLQLSAVVERSEAELMTHRPLVPAEEQVWLAETLRREPRLMAYLYCRGPAVTLTPGKGPDLAVLPRAATIRQAVDEALDWMSGQLDCRDDLEGLPRPLDAVVDARQGSPQEIAHLLLALARGWGVPARYVSGYRARSGAASGSLGYGLYGWVELLMPGLGWQGFDPATTHPTDIDYISVAVGRDAHDASPRRGLFKGPGEEPGATDVKLSIVAQ